MLVLQVKELLKREVEKGDVETQNKSAIIADYKNICSQLSERLDKEQAANASTINMYKVISSHFYSNRISWIPSLRWLSRRRFNHHSLKNYYDFK